MYRSTVFFMLLFKHGIETATYYFFFCFPRVFKSMLIFFRQIKQSQDPYFLSKSGLRYLGQPTQPLPGVRNGNVL